jgi:arachidonate 15-lipoxygenase
MLPQNDPDVAGRQAALEQARHEYRWDHDFLPPLAMLSERGTEHPDAVQAVAGWEFGMIPKDAHPPLRYLVDRFLSLRHMKRNMSRTHSLWARDAFSSLDDYRAMFVELPQPEFMTRWPEDAAFAFQRVGGANPVMLQRVEAPPANFAVSDTLTAQLPDGLSLEALGRSGRLFLCDYAMLQGVTLGTLAGFQKQLAAPLGLFCVAESGDLRPLAIQLGQQRDAQAVFTPASNRKAWLLAKTFLQIADINYHEMGTHLLRTHFLLETFAVAAARTLSSRHPIAVLLKPHFRILIFNNFEGRELLLSPKGLATRLLAGGLKGSTQILQRSYTGYASLPAWSFEDWDLPQAVAARGTNDTAALPGYPYRDDGLLVWAALRGFVSNYLRLYYAGDADVAADSEVQAWAAELAAPSGGRVPGVAAPRTLEALVTMLTRVVFTCGPQHAAVNFPQYDCAAFAPNMPAAAYARAPEAAHTLSDAALDGYLLQVLPPPAQAALQLETVTELTSYRFDRLGYYEDGDFSDPGALQVIAAFQKCLADVGATIGARNRARAIPYSWMLPERITNSTSI